jgi:hypothetical protein
MVRLVRDLRLPLTNAIASQSRIIWKRYWLRKNEKIIPEHREIITTIYATYYKATSGTHIKLENMHDIFFTKH